MQQYVSYQFVEYKHVLTDSKYIATNQSYFDFCEEQIYSRLSNTIRLWFQINT